MLTKQDVLDFKVKLLLEGKHMNRWCRERGLSYNFFVQTLHGHAKMPAHYEEQVVKFLNEGLDYPEDSILEM